MSRFVNEICEMAGLSYGEVSNSIKVYWWKNTVIINNFKKMLTYQSDKVVLASKDNKLSVEGENIKILQFSKDEIILSGKFEKVFLHRIEK